MNFGEWLRTSWDRATGLVLVVAGIIALILGWVGVSATVYPADQLPYIISGGVGGVLLVGLGATAWLSADLRDEWISLERIDEHLRAIASTEAGEAAGIKQSTPIRGPLNGHGEVTEDSEQPSVGAAGYFA
jgi:hypothetical protein